MKSYFHYGASCTDGLFWISKECESAFDAGRHFAQSYTRHMNDVVNKTIEPPTAPSIKDVKNITNQWPDLSNIFGVGQLKQLKNTERVRARLQAIQFMRGIMDEFTHIANYSRPVDCSPIVIVAARDDAYVPRAGTTNLSQLWPESEIRYVKTGHIGAYLLHHSIFRCEFYLTCHQ